MAVSEDTGVEYCSQQVKGSLACCMCSLVVALLSASAGGWHLMFKGGTSGDRCISPLALDPVHSHDGDDFDGVCLSGGTEPSHSSPLDKIYNKTGIYRCACCGEPLFPASTKFNSGTGWPSFWAPLDGDKIGYAKDVPALFGVEVHCKTCGAHLGHVFGDGVGETGYRYCINGVCLRRDFSVELPITTNVPWVLHFLLLLPLLVIGLVSSFRLCSVEIPLGWSCLKQIKQKSKTPVTVAEDGLSPVTGTEYGRNEVRPV